LRWDARQDVKAVAEHFVKKVVPILATVIVMIPVQVIAIKAVRDQQLLIGSNCGI